MAQVIHPCDNGRSVMNKEEEAYSVSLEKINVLRVFGSLCVVLFHSLLYWAVLFPLEDAIEVIL